MDKLRQGYLISYDIEDTRVRNKLYKELLGYGLKGVQKSVFWGYLSRPEFIAIRRDLQKKLGARDKAFIVRSNFNGVGRNFFIGHHEDDFKDWEEYYAI